MWTLIARAVRASGAIEQPVLYLLIAFSVASWALILMKSRSLSRGAAEQPAFPATRSTPAARSASSRRRRRGPAPLADDLRAAVDTLERPATRRASAASRWRPRSCTRR